MESFILESSTQGMATGTFLFTAGLTRRTDLLAGSFSAPEVWHGVQWTHIGLIFIPELPMPLKGGSLHFRITCTAFQIYIVSAFWFITGVVFKNMHLFKAMPIEKHRVEYYLEVVLVIRLFSNWIFPRFEREKNSVSCFVFSPANLFLYIKRCKQRFSVANMMLLSGFKYRFYFSLNTYLPLMNKQGEP